MFMYYVIKKTALYLFLMLIVFSLYSAKCHSKEPITLADLPTWELRNKENATLYKVDPYIEFTNNIQSMKTDDAHKYLLMMAKDKQNSSKLFIVCRMLFVPKKDKEFRRPALGGPLCIGNTSLKDWPLEPIEIVDGVPFLIVEGYILGGSPEYAEEYIKYCIDNCDWSGYKYAKKTKIDKEKALENLLKSTKLKMPLSKEQKHFLASQIE